MRGQGSFSGNKEGWKEHKPRRVCKCDGESTRIPYNIASTFSMEYEVTRGPVDELLQEIKDYQRYNEPMLLKGFNLIRIKISISILSYNLGITIFVEKKFLSLPIYEV